MTCKQVLIQNIRIVLKESGIKHKVVAERAGLTPQMFSDMLNGRKIITAEHVLEIAKALNVDVNVLYGTGQKDTMQRE